MNPFPRILQSAGETVPDAVLVRRFVAERDHAAFELLVRRHADAVWTACRRILKHDADAEDAFQATFLALAKKAGTLREGNTLAGWLYRVAVNASLKLRSQRPDRQGGLSPETLPDGRASEKPSESPACEELAQLTDKYRLPVVLCDLEGHTHAEAAAVLGWPVGTVAGRLSRAREQLRSRLIRRGVVGPAMLTALLADSALSGRAAAVALGLSAVPPSVSTLAEGVLVAMSTLKWKLTAAVAVGLICVVGTGTYVVTGQSPALPGNGQTPAGGGQPAGVTVRKVQKLSDGRLTLYPEIALDFEKVLRNSGKEPLKVVPVDEDNRSLQRARYDALTETIRLDSAVLNIGSWDVPFLNQFLINLIQYQTAIIEAFPKPVDHLPKLRDTVVLMFRLENVVYERVFTAKNLRMQQYLQADGTRTAGERVLYLAELRAAAPVVAELETRVTDLEKQVRQLKADMEAIKEKGAVACAVSVGSGGPI